MADELGIVSWVDSPRGGEGDGRWRGLLRGAFWRLGMVAVAVVVNVFFGTFRDAVMVLVWVRRVESLRVSDGIVELTLAQIAMLVWRDAAQTIGGSPGRRKGSPETAKVWWGEQRQVSLSYRKGSHILATRQQSFVIGGTCQKRPSSGRHRPFCPNHLTVFAERENPANCRYLNPFRFPGLHAYTDLPRMTQLPCKSAKTPPRKTLS